MVVRPAACHVDPAVKSDFSRRTTSCFPDVWRAEIHSFRVSLIHSGRIRFGVGQVSDFIFSKGS